jgi:hypothetical protein
MANLSTSSIFDKHEQNFCDNDHHHKDLKLFTLPFSEYDVLVLQEIFVTLGVHTIKTKNVIDGRQIIQTILKSLNYYHNVGSVTQIEGLPVFTCDIMKHIGLQFSQRNNLLIDLEEFFAVHPCFDFIWIEFTQEIKSQCSIEDIKNLFDIYHVNERMPVLIVMYEE